LKRSCNLELHALETEEGKSDKKFKVEVINVEDHLEKEAQLETRIVEKFKKETVYSIDTLPSIFMKPPGEGTTNVKPQSLFSKFDDISNKNEQIKELWSQKLKLDLPETRLLSEIDFEKGKLNLEILESSGPSIRG
jgi:hypothetical protein